MIAYDTTFKLQLEIVEITDVALLDVTVNRY
jgi:hypothetical protein